MALALKESELSLFSAYNTRPHRLWTFLEVWSRPFEMTLLRRKLLCQGYKLLIEAFGIHNLGNADGKVMFQAPREPNASETCKLMTLC